jgi:hypothetical protein
MKTVVQRPAFALAVVQVKEYVKHVEAGPEIIKVGALCEIYWDRSRTDEYVGLMKLLPRMQEEGLRVLQRVELQSDAELTATAPPVIAEAVSDEVPHSQSQAPLKEGMLRMNKPL